MEHLGNILIFNYPGTLFGNITRNFTGNFFRIFWEYIMGMFHEYSTNIVCPMSSYLTKQLFVKTHFMRGSAQPAFACSNSIELTSTMFKVNNKDTRTTSFDVFLVFYVNFKQIYTSCTIADVDQVNIQRVECSITLVGNDVLPRSLQLKHFCNMSNCVMSKIRAITKICRCANSLIH